jgi:lipid II isoglutaminyl synthase (glutamine-hydrolysing)
MSTLMIATLFPLDTVAAGDEANGPALARRARQRGIEATHMTVTRRDAMVRARIYLLGGDGLAGVSDLVTHLRATTVAEEVRAGRAIVLAVDAGLAAIGHSWTDPAGASHDGLDLVGFSARARPSSLVSTTTAPAPDLGLPAMIGWHSRTFELTRDPGVHPLVELASGDPSAGAALDGVLTPGVIGTQLHGPVLALNPELADLVLARALGVPGWDPLPIPAVETARARRIAELSGRRHRAARGGASRWVARRRT